MIIKQTSQTDVDPNDMAAALHNARDLDLAIMFREWRIMQKRNNFNLHELAKYLVADFLGGDCTSLITELADAIKFHQTAKRIRDEVRK